MNLLLASGTRFLMLNQPGTPRIVALPFYEGLFSRNSRRADGSLAESLCQPVPHLKPKPANRNCGRDCLQAARFSWRSITVRRVGVAGRLQFATQGQDRLLDGGRSSRRVWWGPRTVGPSDAIPPLAGGQLDPVKDRVRTQAELAGDLG